MADGKGYSFEAPTRFDKLFSGIMFPRPSYVPVGRRGLEDMDPEDTFDGDYGRLLEKAQKTAEGREDKRVNGEGYVTPGVGIPLIGPPRPAYVQCAPKAQDDGLEVLRLAHLANVNVYVNSLIKGVEIDASFLRALEEFRMSCVVRYQVEGVPRAGWHDVSVKVTKSGHSTVRTRKGYGGG